MSQTVQLQLERSLDNEWRVAVYIGGRFQEGPTYYTDDVRDARETRDRMAEEFTQAGDMVAMPRRPRVNVNF